MAFQVGICGQPTATTSSWNSTHPWLPFLPQQDGDIDADIETASPVRAVRPVRAYRLLVPKLPTPAIRTSSPFARASPPLTERISDENLYRIEIYQYFR